MSGAVEILGRDRDGNIKESRLSSTCINALAVAQEIDVLREDGKEFQAYTEITVGAGATEYILGITPEYETRRVMMTERKIMAVVSTGNINIDVDLLRDVTSATTTANVTAFNANHNSDREGLFLIHDNPATVTGGVQMPNGMKIVSDATTAQAGGTQSGAYEMKANTKYALRIVNNGSQTVTIRIFWEWAEVI